MSLECGPTGGGHGHADRLHLTVYGDDVLWLADPGTGSYVTPDLAWYRSTLGHNAPRVDGASQHGAAAVCEAFEVRGDWAWVRGRWGEFARTVVGGPGYVLDLVRFASRGSIWWSSPGTFSAAAWRHRGAGKVAWSEVFTSRAERFLRRVRAASSSWRQRTGTARGFT